jgi:hypothetical protein
VGRFIPSLYLGAMLTEIVIARQALAQEEVGEFNSDFPETIPIDLKGNEGGCAC